MKTYTIEELENTRKTGMDYVKEHENMLKSLKSGQPAEEEDPKGLWVLPYSSDPFWTHGNLLNQEDLGYGKMEGCGVVPKKIPENE